MPRVEAIFHIGKADISLEMLPGFITSLPDRLLFSFMRLTMARIMSIVKTESYPTDGYALKEID